MSDVLQHETGRSPLSGFLSDEEKYRVIFEAVSDGIFISDPATGHFIEINQPGCKMFGYPKDELLGRDVDLLSSGVPPHSQEEALALNEKARLGQPQIFEWVCKTKQGALFWTEISLRYSEFGGAPAIVAIIRDIAERKRMDAQITYLAHHDALTGLTNRPMFALALQRATARALRTGRKFAILSLDLDNFKDVNDARGHQAGDELLRMAADRLRAVIRVDENVARFGGDEFAILLDDLHDPEEVGALAKRIIATLTKPFSIDGSDLRVGASIGVAIYGEGARDAETLLSQADMAMYRAKADGRHAFCLFSEEMNEEVRSRVLMTDQLRHAIWAGDLFLVYQPQVKATTGRIIGVEALVRWRHAQRGVLMPDIFLPLAESSGLIGKLGEWVLREACRQGRAWIDEGIAPGTIAVNLATAQFRDPHELERIVFAVLAETGFPPHLLELEITESTLIDVTPRHDDVIQRLRRAGIRFSLDDFGTGYSAMNYLRQFSVDRIKIAQDFISELTTSAQAASIVKLMLGLARDFGNEVIAEGVETSDQLHLLQSLDCTDVQGFYFATPMGAEEIAPLLSLGSITPAQFSTAAFAAKSR